MEETMRLYFAVQLLLELNWIKVVIFTQIEAFHCWYLKPQVVKIIIEKAFLKKMEKTKLWSAYFYLKTASRLFSCGTEAEYKPKSVGKNKTNLAGLSLIIFDVFCIFDR